MPNPRMYEGPEVGSSEDEEITEAEVGWDMGAIEVSVPTNGGSDANVGITLGMENGEIFIESVDETGPFASQIGKFPPRARLLQVNHQDTSEVTDLYVLYNIIREAQGGLTLKIKEAPARRAVTPAALESTPDDPQTMPSDIDYKDQYLTVTEILERQRQRASEELQQGVGRGVAMAATAVNVVPLVQASEVNTAADTVDDTRDPSSNNQGGSVTKKGDSSTRKGDSSIQETTSSAASPPKRWKLYTGILVLVCAVGAVIGVLMSGGSSSSGSDNKALESEPARTDQEQGKLSFIKKVVAGMHSVQTRTLMFYNTFRFSKQQRTKKFASTRVSRALMPNYFGIKENILINHISLFSVNSRLCIRNANYRHSWSIQAL